jgi:3'(2'), 5'-bisphosphate nucleotidase
MVFELNTGYKIELDEVLSIAKNAGAAILEIYNDAPEKMNVRYKDDQSPLTLADSASHQVITSGLTALTPDIPVLSEEGKDIPYNERRNWKLFWCVDPLDGTKEFIQHNGEFTVNIALIHETQPILGIIYIPVTDTMYFGGLNIGSWKIDSVGKLKKLQSISATKECIAVGSRTHSSPEEAAYLAKHHVTNIISAGSSLKFCMIAEGSAQIYYRHGPTMEWDTAAGHAIAVYSGAYLSKPNGDTFSYNKVELLNSGFICSATSISKE